MDYYQRSLALLSCSIIIISLLLTSTLSLPATTTTDREALLSFKSLLFDPNGSLSSWTNVSLDHCRWPGITCSPHSPYRVTALDLGALGLSGTISPSISNLTFLRILHLPENQLYGPIPPDLSHLLRLEYLNLSMNSLSGNIPQILSPRLRKLSLRDNALSGEIPSSLTACHTLQALILDNNNLTGKIPPFTANSNLYHLGLSSNNLTGEIPHSLGNLSYLQHLFLNENNLKGSIPKSLGGISFLQKLDLYQNNLSSTIPSSLYNLSDLTHLDLGVNKLTGMLPPDIGLALPKLQSFVVMTNRLQGMIPISLSNASSLQTIQLANNLFTGELPNNLGSLPNLTIFILQNNQLQTKDWSFLSSLTNCSRLQILGLYDNRIEGSLPSIVGNLSTQLQRLVLGKNRITGYIPDEIGNLINLTLLSLEQNQFIGSIPSTIGKLRNIDVLNLSKNKLSGTIPTSLSNLPRLEVLSLQENYLTGAIPKSLQNFTTLLVSNLSHNSLTERIPREVFSITSLTQLLDLSHNSLTGLLPIEVGHLINLGFLDVSENRLSGDIPQSLGSCQALEYLIMTGNSFQGSIPHSFSKLGGLSKLDLSHNNLSGEIPNFFKNFYSLYLLNLSYNNFEGEVPSGGVFNKSGQVSLIGNKKLCSDHPMLHLSSCTIPSNRKLKPLVIIIPAVSILMILLLCYSAILYQRKKSSTKYQSLSFFSKYLKVSYADISKATNEFSSSNLIGTGSFGAVYRAKLDIVETDVAVKVLNLSRKGASKSFIAECKTLRNIRHRNLVKIITTCSCVDPRGNDFKALIFEHMPNGNLDRWLHPEATNEKHQLKKLTLVQRLNIAVDVAYALDYLHNNCDPPVVHCDLKPSNILLDNNMIAHVGDFGLSEFLDKLMLQKSISSTGIKGSLGYVAPEYGMDGQISKQGDIYSFGVLLLEMLTGKRPTDDMFKDGLNLHEYAKFAFPENVMKILDPHILQDEVEVNPNSSNQQSMSAGQARTRRCIFSLVRIGLLCSNELPKNRMGIRQATIEIHEIKKLLLIAYVQEVDEI